MRSAVALLALTACASPVPVIFDSDMASDCDDVGALAILHALADLGEVRILATMTSSQNPETPPCIDAINTWYGRPDLPIGAPKGKGAARKSKYAAGIAQAFPHDLTAAGDAAAMYREILQREPDGSVVIVTVGYLTNLADLLRLPDGPDLVRRKVRLWVCMGGNFVGKPAHDDVKLSNNNFTVEKDMTFDWRTDRDSGQGYLLKRPGTDRRIEREIEDLMMQGRR